MNVLSDITRITRFLRMNQTSGSGGVAQANNLPHDPRDDDYHRLMDRLMRLPKIGLLFCAIAVLVWPMFDAPAFTEWATAINTLSDNAWTAIILIIASWATTSVVKAVKTPMPSYSRSSVPSTTTSGKSGRLENTVKDDSHVVSETGTQNSALDAWKNK